MEVMCIECSDRNQARQDKIQDSYQDDSRQDNSNQENFNSRRNNVLKLKRLA